MEYWVFPSLHHSTTPLRPSTESAIRNRMKCFQQKQTKITKESRFGIGASFPSFPSVHEKSVSSVPSVVKLRNLLRRLVPPKPLAAEEAPTKAGCGRSKTVIPGQKESNRVKPGQTESNRVKPGQSAFQPLSSGQRAHRPRHILRVPQHNPQQMVVGLCGGQHGGQAIRNWPIVWSQAQSNPVKPFLQP